MLRQAAQQFQQRLTSHASTKVLTVRAGLIEPSVDRERSCGIGDNWSDTSIEKPAYLYGGSVRHNCCASQKCHRENMGCHEADIIHIEGFINSEGETMRAFVYDS